VLLHHKSGDITTHYSPSELEELINLKKSVEFNPAKNIQHKLDKIFSIIACI
jgi:hypothetical protein